MEGCNLKKISTIFFLTIILGISCLAQGMKIKKGSTVYVAPMHGYEAYIIAALQKERVPVVVILDRYKAQYIIGGVVNRKDFGRPSVVVNNTNNVGSSSTSTSPAENGFERGQAAAHARMMALGETSASISVLDPKTTAIVFSYTTEKMGTAQLKKNAEDFAKHLRKFIEKEK